MSLCLLPPWNLPPLTCITYPHPHRHLSAGPSEQFNWYILNWPVMLKRTPLFPELLSYSLCTNTAIHLPHSYVASATLCLILHYWFPGSNLTAEQSWFPAQQSATLGSLQQIVPSLQHLEKEQGCSLYETCMEEWTTNTHPVFFKFYSLSL